MEIACPSPIATDWRSPDEPREHADGEPLLPRLLRRHHRRRDPGDEPLPRSSRARGQHGDQCAFTPPQLRGLESLHRAFSPPRVLGAGLPPLGPVPSGPPRHRRRHPGGLLGLRRHLPAVLEDRCQRPARPPAVGVDAPSEGGVLGGRIAWNFTKFLIDATAACCAASRHRCLPAASPA